MRRKKLTSYVSAEVLEIRVFPAASPFVLMNGDLIITGTARSNTISVTESNGQVIAKIDRRQQSFDAALIGHVEIFALGGNDKIIVATAKGAIIDSGSGNDRVICTPETRGRIFGGIGNDYLRGGDVGNDIFGDAGNDTLIGGNGDDLMFGDAGNDSLVGGNQEDTMYGGGGNDRVLGGNGRDYILDIAGSNFLDGGNDDDELIVLSGKNTILGGSGNDAIHIEYTLPPTGIIDGGSGDFDRLYCNLAGGLIIEPRLLFGDNMVIRNVEESIYGIYPF